MKHLDFDLLLVLDDEVDSAENQLGSQSIFALGFPCKTSAEIAPDLLKLSEAASVLRGEESAETRITIALCRC